MHNNTIVCSYYSRFHCNSEGDYIISSMKSVVSISSSVRAVCQYSPNYFMTSSRGLIRHSDSLGRILKSDVSFKARLAQLCVKSSLGCFHNTREMGAVAQQLSNLPFAEEKDYELRVHLEKDLLPKTAGQPSIDTQLGTSASPTQLGHLKVEPLSVKSLFEVEVLPELLTRLKEASSNEKTEGLATLLGVCVEFGVDYQSSIVSRLKEEWRTHLSKTDIGVIHLCHLGEVAYNLEGKRSEIVEQVLDSVSISIDEGEALTQNETARVYSFLALLEDPHRCQDLMSRLHRHTEKLTHRLQAINISDIFHSLVALQQRQAIALIVKLSRRASRVFRSFQDEELIKVLAALMHFGQHDEDFITAMEKHLPGKIVDADPELTSVVMEFCLQMRCRSEPIFEAVAESFICNSEKYTTSQIARQIIAMGRLSYLPQCSSQMFKKLESILSSRFSQFQPRALIEVLHSCIHLERFPLNFVSKVFSPYFLQRLQAQGEPLDKHALGQLTQLNLSISLECTYRGPRLPYHLHVKKFSSMDHSFESPVESYLYNQVKGPLNKLLEGKTYYSTRVFTQPGYTIDVEICLDEEGFVLPLSQWDHTHRRIALCLDAQDRFCSNTHHLLGKEATKRRHLCRMGYEVVQIPYFEFEKLRTQEERVQYLHKKIFPTIFRFYR
ncbi:FAST kinase domain-containing protein 3, mitochondrial-like isoform X1 [Salvelinus fontinalis]|uniref:FAST kinase domain-containing protein 3, mitochondrial-like isoform X1 n=2 Tax=Salvelinus fontinalis TaxID=8038 RepID=UPI002485D3CB|nr:FAST kinase domain-containing protein 3, mitochondrial-like isoform X1 [Salvelinus fontinalis]